MAIHGKGNQRYILECMTNKMYKQVVPKQIGVLELGRCEDRSLDDPDDETVEDLFDWGANDKEFTWSRWSQDGVGALRESYDVIMIAPISHLIKDEELIIVPDGSSFLIPYACPFGSKFRVFVSKVENSIGSVTSKLEPAVRVCRGAPLYIFSCTLCVKELLKRKKYRMFVRRWEGSFDQDGS